MRHALKSIACPRSCSASVVDGKLILSFPHAATPVVWQMDLDNAKASALEVRESRGDNASFTLTLKTPRGEALDIALFSSRAQAVEGLMAAAKALESGHGQIRPVSGTGTASARPSKPASRGKWLGAFLGLVFLLVLLGVWSSVMPRPPRMAHSGSPAGFEAPADQGEPGVPQSADQFLKGH